MPVTRPLSILLAAAALLAAAPGAEAAKRRVPQGFYGVMWDGDVKGAPAAEQDAQFDLMAKSGVESVRTVFSWNDLQPDPGTPPDLAATDEFVARAAARGIQLLPVTLYPPIWARAYGERYNSPPKRPEDYGAFLQALIARYGPKGTLWTERSDLPRVPIRHWQIWNEPDIQEFWNATPGQSLYWPEGYPKTLRAAHRAIAQADPKAKVVLAGLTNLSWETLARLEKSGPIRKHYDIAGFQTYTGNAERWLRALTLFRAALDEHGARKVPIWVTETAFPASKGRKAEVPSYQRNLQTTDQGMAKRVKQIYDAAVREGLGKPLGVERVFWYTWASSYRSGGNIFRFAGLSSYDGKRYRRKRALKAYRRSAQRHEGCAKDTAGACR